MRQFRFGLSLGDPADRDDLVAVVQRAESAGFSTVSIADHLIYLSPLVTAAAAAQAARRIRVGTLTINNDLRHPAVLAQEAAAVDMLSDGRLELGLGAGHARSEYEAAGVPFDDGATRVARLGESIEILRGLFGGESVTFHGEHYHVTDLQLDTPRPPQGASLPILVGGNGPHLLRVAARLADIVQFTGFTRRGDDFDFSAVGGAGFARRCDVFKEAAGDRIEHVELSALVQEVVITDDRREAAAARVERGLPSEDVVLDSPFFLIGTLRQIADQLRSLRDRYGLSYFSVFDGRSDGFEAVVEELTGT